MYFDGHKRTKFTTPYSDHGKDQNRTANVINCSDQFALSNLLEELNGGKYGTVTKEFQTLHAHRMQVMNLLSKLRASPSKVSLGVIDLDSDSVTDAADSAIEHGHQMKTPEFGGDLWKDRSIIVIDSDEEDGHQVKDAHSPSSRSEACKSQAFLMSQVQMHCKQLVPFENVAVRSTWKPNIQFEKVVLGSATNQQLNGELVNLINGTRRHKRKGKTHGQVEEVGEASPPISAVCTNGEALSMKSYSPDQKETPDSDGLDDLWRDMSLAMECSKIDKSDELAVVHREEDCEHSYLLQDDLGLVCRICGVIQKSIETIFDYQWTKPSRSSRSYISGSQNSIGPGQSVPSCRARNSEDDFIAAEVSVHPRHLKQMKPHQIEGFSFLLRNLVSDKPGGCILAHAPGSGKTFMLISFIQSFLAKYPFARTLVVLPKGILPTWKKEFQRWQVEDIPLYDFYSTKADHRLQQLEILIKWENSKSILFLGYKQFSTIVCETTSDKISAACQERLLTVPSLLILDEGHTPRNDSTDMVSSLAKVQTPRKVVLSGTLFQNHVKEVFNILNLVRPKFLKMDTSRIVKKRILSRVNIPGNRRSFRGDIDAAFFELVEETLQNDENYKTKISVIQDLREMTHNVLHYYKGDFLEELPGLVDFTVLLNLGYEQKEMVKELGKLEKFKRLSVGSAVYIHPKLKDIAEKTAGDRGFSDEKIDNILDRNDIKEGVKTRFFLDILSLAEAAGEKVLAFSHYHLPMKFLETILVRIKGWRVGKEIFMITGDTGAEDRELFMEQFNTSPEAKILFGSIKACGEGISLVGASRVMILDVHLNPSVTRQAIGRAYRPGQVKKVYIYRLVAADSPEEEDHRTSFRKELISKLWFEWSEYCDHRDFELEKVDIAECDDTFLESHNMERDIKMLYRR